MTLQASPPLLDARNADDVVAQVGGDLAATGWKGATGEPGWALVRLFGRLSELVIARLNQVPNKHFLAFLNEAGLDLLPPRPASSELTFTPAKDVTGALEVPAGTQVATKQTETQPEVVFETLRDLVVSPAALVKAVVFDPLTSADRTALATGSTSDSSFAVFTGEAERERILYLGDSELFSFPDAATRAAAVVNLSFELARPGNPLADGWKLEWLIWNGSLWSKLAEGSQVTDGTAGFSKQNGVVSLKQLPEMLENGATGLWLACKLTGGAGRRHLPVFRGVTGTRTIRIGEATAVPDAALSAVNAGTTFVPADPTGEFFPLGQFPARLDTFYLRVDEAFSKPGVNITLDMSLTGLPKDFQPKDKSLIKSLEITWDYSTADGWCQLGTSTWSADSSATRLGFADATRALTKPGIVTWRVPGGEQDKDEKPFAKTTVNGQEGYWVRARINQGDYEQPGGLTTPLDAKTPPDWIRPVTYAPFVTSLVVKYANYQPAASAPKDVANRQGLVDGMWRDHSTAKSDFAPYSAAEEGPALNLGFQPGFPAGSWIQLLLDVEEPEEGAEDLPAIFWEYWNGSEWRGLRASDGTQGLRQRGYLGFFGPADHPLSTEFGQEAYWLRARPYASPVAAAGEDVSVPADGNETQVTLDASGSQAFGRDRRVARYIWRMLPEAEAGAEQTVGTAGAEAVVTLDASGSRAAAGQSITRYLWRRQDEPATSAASAEPAAPAMVSPYLKVIRTNTVPASNMITVREEVLGFSNGEPDQVFALSQPPVLPGARIVVQEPDLPPGTELAELEAELRTDNASAHALPAGPTVDESLWVQWHLVADFYNSGPASRHFALDPITGEVRFGDGERGKIPPVGQNNIKALVYRTHSGSAGNVASGAITAVRNPSGDLAKIKTASNPEAAAGGSDAETVAEVQVRGPQALKHRQRAVTIEDYVWLAREASGEVAQAWCLPTRNAIGLPDPGWVTVVVLPEGAEAKPIPSPALRRTVQSYLEAHALVNLGAAGQIRVEAPEYIEAVVLARVVPVEPEEADEVELAILGRLEAFLHPLTGGPSRTGWELGRDVYLSEICAEIEAVAGVDYVAGVQLQSSLQQRRLRLGVVRSAPFDVAVGSQVSSFDERIKVLLAQALPRGEPVSGLAIYGFKVGDEVRVVAADNMMVKENLSINALDGDTVTFDLPFPLPPAWGTRAALLSLDGRLRLLIAGDSVDESEHITGVALQGFAAGDKACVVAGALRHPDLELLPIATVEPCQDRIFVPPGHLVYSGGHDIEMELE